MKRKTWDNNVPGRGDKPMQETEEGKNVACSGAARRLWWLEQSEREEGHKMLLERAGTTRPTVVLWSTVGNLNNILNVSGGKLHWSRNFVV